MFNISLQTIFGWLLIVAGLLDAWKYIWHVQAIVKTKSAKSHSRKFANAAITQDIVKLFYGLIIHDMYIFLSTLFALVTMSIYFYTIYLFYPYRGRGLNGFKRPSLYIYIINSLLPNKIRRRL